MSSGDKHFPLAEYLGEKGMKDEEQAKWYTFLETNEGNADLFSPTLAEAKKALIEWLIQTKPTQLTIGGVPPITYEKTRGGSWIRIHAERTVLATMDDSALYEAIVPWVFTQTGPGYEETVLDSNERKICLERVKTIAKQDDIDLVNLMLRRGWYLLALEHLPEKILYIMGHEEYEAF